MDLLTMSMPWCMFILGGVLGYIGVLILIRRAGKHSLREMSPFDMVHPSASA